MKTKESAKRASVLVVDDSAIYIQSLAKLLKGDYHILVAKSGNRALMVAQGNDPPDLILLDIEMPEMDGYEVCRRLKENPRTQDIPVIFVTGKDKAEEEEVGFNLGAVDYISKPFHPAVVKARVKSQTERRLAEQKNREYSMKLEELNRQLDEEIDKARQVHERTLPKSIPHLQGLSLATHYQPAAKVGGDFYNVICAGNKLVLFLSDVTGHGLEGALFSVFVKEALDSYVSLKTDEISPEKMLQHLDHQFRRENYPEDYFVCIFLAVLDLETMVLTYASAGFQDAPKVCLNGNQYEELTCQGLPISSALPRELLDFQEHTITFTPGATLFCSTDGLSEQVVEGHLYGSRLNKTLAACCGLPPEGVVQCINDDFRSFNQGTLQGDDDITVVVLQADPDPRKADHPAR